ncbi:MAG TPA: polyprenyl synthetase family protein [Ktedonobacterales bacterium]|jgi:geranylgeranyl diphosphate synthase type I
MKAVEPPALLERYRPAIEQSILRLLEHKPDGLYQMVRYHFGWTDEQGHILPRALGKAIRPTLCLLACEAAGGAWERALPAAAALELVHNFSLIHDDIQDGDQERHHRPTVWTLWGYAQAINAGDAAFALSGVAVEQLREQGFPAEMVLHIWQLLNAATLRLVEGQYLDLAFEQRLDVTVEEYLGLVGRKTGTLIETAAHIGALLGTSDTGLISHLRWYGQALGLAFQIGDDLLGIWGTPAETGKPVAADLRRRKKSLPVIFALQSAPPRDKARLMALYQQDEQTTLNDEEVEITLGILERARAEERTRGMLAQYCSKAMLELERAHLPPWARAEFSTFARFLAERRY